MCFMWASSSLKQSKVWSQRQQSVEMRMLILFLRRSSCLRFQWRRSSFSNSARSLEPSGQAMRSGEKGRILSLLSPWILMAKQWVLAQAQVVQEKSQQLPRRRVQKWLSISLKGACRTLPASTSSRSRQISRVTPQTLVIFASRTPHSPQQRYEKWSTAFSSIALTSASFSRFHLTYCSRRHPADLPASSPSPRKLGFSLTHLSASMNGRSPLSAFSSSACLTASRQASLSSGCCAKSSPRKACSQRSSSTMSWRGWKRNCRRWRGKWAQREGSESRLRQLRTMPRRWLACWTWAAVRRKGRGRRQRRRSCRCSQRVRWGLVARARKGQKSRWARTSRWGTQAGRREAQRADSREPCLARQLATRNFPGSSSFTFTTRFSEQQSIVTVCSRVNVTARPCPMWSISPRHFSTSGRERQLPPLSLSSTGGPRRLSSTNLRKRNCWREWESGKCRQLSPRVRVRSQPPILALRSMCVSQARLSFSSASAESGLRRMEELRRQRVLAARTPLRPMWRRRFSWRSSWEGARTRSRFSMKPQRMVSWKRSFFSPPPTCSSATRRYSSLISCGSPRSSSLFRAIRRSMSFTSSLASEKVQRKGGSSWRRCLRADSVRRQSATRERKSQLSGLSTACRYFRGFFSMVQRRTGLLLWLRTLTSMSMSSQVPKSRDSTSSLQQVMSMGRSTYSLPKLVSTKSSPLSSSPPQNCSDRMAESMFLSSGGWMADPSTSPGSRNSSLPSPSCSNLIRRTSLSREERWISGVEYSGSFLQKPRSTRRKTSPSQSLPVLPARWLQLAWLAHTSSRLSMRLRRSNLTSFDRQKSTTYFTPLTVMLLSAMLVAMITRKRLPGRSCSRRVSSQFRIVECTASRSNSRSTRSVRRKLVSASIRLSISPSPGMKTSTEGLTGSRLWRTEMWSTIRQTVAQSYLCVLGYFSLKTTDPHRRSRLGMNSCSVSRQQQSLRNLPGSVTLMAGQGCSDFMNSSPWIRCSSCSSALSSLLSSSPGRFKACCARRRRWQKFWRVGRESTWSSAKQQRKRSLSMVALMSSTRSLGCLLASRFKVSRMKSVSMSRSWTQSSTISGQSSKKAVPCTMRCRKMPLVTNRMRFCGETCDCRPIWQPTSPRSGICRSSSDCRLSTASLRGCTHMIRDLLSPTDRRYSQSSLGT